MIRDLKNILGNMDFDPEVKEAGLDVLDLAYEIAENKIRPNMDKLYKKQHKKDKLVNDLIYGDYEKLKKKDLEEKLKEIKDTGSEKVILTHDKLIMTPGTEKLYEQVASLGFMGLFVDENYGGMELPYPFAAAVKEIFCSADNHFGLGLCVHDTLMDMITKMGSDSIKEKYLPDMAAGKKKGAICFTEPGAGSDLASARTIAELKGDKYILNGTKIFITNGGYSDVYVVLASTDLSKGYKGQAAFLVEKDFPGFQVASLFDKIGLASSPTAELIFDECEVPKENILGGEGKGLSYVLQGLSGGRIGIAAWANGTAYDAFRRAGDYAIVREQFGKPIIEYQEISGKLAYMDTLLSAARTMYLNAAKLKYEGKPFETFAAKAKMMAADNAVKICDDAIQVMGGAGYMRDYHVERLLRDARMGPIGEGTAEIQRMIISRDIIKDIRKRLN